MTNKTQSNKPDLIMDSDGEVLYILDNKVNTYIDVDHMFHINRTRYHEFMTISDRLRRLKSRFIPFTQAIEVKERKKHVFKSKIIDQQKYHRENSLSPIQE